MIRGWDRHGRSSPRDFPPKPVQDDGVVYMHPRADFCLLWGHLVHFFFLWHFQREKGPVVNSSIGINRMVNELYVLDCNAFGKPVCCISSHSIRCRITRISPCPRCAVFLGNVGQEQCEASYCVLFARNFGIGITIGSLYYSYMKLVVNGNYNWSSDCSQIWRVPCSGMRGYVLCEG